MTSNKPGLVALQDLRKGSGFNPLKSLRPVVEINADLAVATTTDDKILAPITVQVEPGDAWSQLAQFVR